MNIDERLDHYIVRCEALDAEGIGALLKEIKKERQAALRCSRRFTEHDVREAYACVRRNNDTIADEALDDMRAVLLLSTRAEPTVPNDAQTRMQFEDEAG